MNKIVTKSTLVEMMASRGNAKPVVWIDGGKVYSSCHAAAKAHGMSQSQTSSVCRGIFEHAHGKRFCYLSDISLHLNKLLSTVESYRVDALSYREGKEAEERERREKVNNRIAELKTKKNELRKEVRAIDNQKREKSSELKTIREEIKKLEAIA